jgi:hypothetical protein
MAVVLRHLTPTIPRDDWKKAPSRPHLLLRLLLRAVSADVSIQQLLRLLHRLLHRLHKPNQQTQWFPILRHAVARDGQVRNNRECPEIYSGMHHRVKP